MIATSGELPSKRNRPKMLPCVRKAWPSSSNHPHPELDKHSPPGVTTQLPPEEPSTGVSKDRLIERPNAGPSAPSNLHHGVCTGTATHLRDSNPGLEISRARRSAAALASVQPSVRYTTQEGTSYSHTHRGRWEQCGAHLIVVQSGIPRLQTWRQETLLGYKRYSCWRRRGKKSMRGGVLPDYWRDWGSGVCRRGRLLCCRRCGWTSVR